MILCSGSQTKSNLLIEPVVLPNLAHLTVEESIHPSNDCLFYPTGSKKVNMKMEFERTIQSYVSYDAKSLSRKQFRNSKKSTKTNNGSNSVYAGSTLTQRTPLCYTKKKDPKVDELIRKARSNESELYGTINIRT